MGNAEMMTITTEIREKLENVCNECSDIFSNKGLTVIECFMVVELLKMMIEDTSGVKLSACGFLNKEDIGETPTDMISNTCGNA